MAENVGYSALHWRVRQVRGRASDYPCVRCSEYGVGRRARHWATIHGTDGTDPFADYVPMCQQCHFAYDGVNEGNRGVPKSPEHRAAISAGKKGKPTHRKSPDEISRIKAKLKGRPSPTRGMKMGEATKEKHRTRMLAGQSAAMQEAAHAARWGTHRRPEIRALLREDSQRTNTYLRQLTGYSLDLIREVRAELEHSGTIEPFSRKGAR